MSYCTFNGCTFSGGAGWALQLWGAESGATHHLTFKNTTVNATEGGYPVVVGYGFSDITFSNTQVRASSQTEYQDVVRFYGGSNITFDGFAVMGGRYLVIVADNSVSGIQFKNGAFSGTDLLYNSRGTSDVLFQNVSTSTGI